MARFEEIGYLRWARSQAAPPFPEIGLTASGMTPPDPAVLGDLTTAELLSFAVADHPPLALRLAELWRVAPERVLVQPGSHLSIFLLLAARLDECPGPVVVEEPAYEPLWRIPEALGATVIRWPRPVEAGYALDPSSLERLVQARPSVVVLSHPHNPTGARIGPADRTLLRRLQTETGCAILSDEVYLEFLEDPHAHTLLHEPGPVAVVRSFTKVFGLSTLRASAMAGEPEWIAHTASITDFGAVALPGPSQALAQRALDRREALWGRARETARVGRELVEGFAARVGERLEFTLPEAGIITFVRPHAELHAALVARAKREGVTGPFGFGLDEFPDGAHYWLEDLRRRRGVQLTPGAFFGDARGFRLGFGVDPGILGEGLRRVEDHLREVMEER